MSAALESLMYRMPDRQDVLEHGGIFSFLLIGALGAAAFVGLSGSLVVLVPQVASWVIGALSYAVLIVPVYLLQRRFSFRSDTPHRRALPRYVAVQAIAAVLGALFGFIANGVMALPGLPVALLVVGLTAGANFMVLRNWAFARGPKKAISPGV